MSSTDIEEIYNKLLQIYETKYPHNPRHVLSYKISELVGEGKTRETAILTLYEEEGKITRVEAKELGEVIRKKKEEAIEQKIKEYEENVEKLTLLFSKGELNKESYKAAIKPLEEKIAKLRIESLEEKLVKLKKEKKEKENTDLKRESFEEPVPSPTVSAPEERLDLKTISKYFMHGFAFSVIMIALVFVWIFIGVFLVAVGSVIGLIMGFIVLLFMISGLNSFLTDAIWSIPTKTEWVSLLGHGLVLFFALIIAHIPSIIISLTIPSLTTMILLFIIEAFINGFVAKNVAVFWEEEEE